MTSILTWMSRTLLRHTLAATFELPSPELSRRLLERYARMIPTPPGTCITPESLDGLPAEWVVGRGVSESSDVILYLHGGGFIAGSPATYRGFATTLSRACDSRLLLPDYRLAPEHPHPAAEDDCFAAYRWLLSSGVAADRIVLGGDSAGGFLSLRTLLRIRDEKLPSPRAAFLLSPVTDALHIDGESYTTRAQRDPWLNREAILRMRQAYANGRSDVELCPIRCDLSGLPRLLVHVGDDEVLLSDSIRLAAKAEAEGVDVSLRVWPEMWHDFQLFAPILPSARESIAEIGRFARRLA